MYKALYKYSSDDENALSFNMGDSFTLIDGNRDPHWWLVHNGKGQLGFVPANYLEQDKASHADVLKSIDRAIAAIHAVATKTSGVYTEDQRTNLQKLQQHRETYVNQHELDRSDRVGVTATRPVPPVPNSASSSSVTATRLVPPVPSSAPSSSQNGVCQSMPVSVPPLSDVSKLKRAPPSRESVIQTTPEDTVHTTKVTSEPQPGASSSSNGHVVKKTSQKLPDDVAKSAENAMLSERVSSPTTKMVSSANVFASPSTSRNQVSRSNLYDSLSVPKGLGPELVEQIRTSTGLSYQDSAAAVGCVVSSLGQRVHGLQKVMDKILDTLQVDQIDADLSSDDAKRLQHIFGELASCKDDSQQRSWFLHEDEHIINELLEELLFILNGANSDLCRAIIASNDYTAIHNLVVYYQMETRSTLRMLLLQVFGSLCGLSSRIISELLNSVLPSELARDILSDTQDIQKFYFSALVLAMIFSMGEPLGLQYYSQLNPAFVSGLLEMVENPPETDEDMKVSDLLINVVLAFNLHFELPSENIVMKVFAERKTAKEFTEKVLVFVNRGVDPVRLFEHEPKPPNSVLKFFADVYSHPATSDLLYTNDVKVLIDIILRQITDLTAGDSVRTEHLSILELLLKNHNYSEHTHRRQELELCFRRIYQEEESEGDFDKRIVAQIWMDNPDLFESSCV